jgi:hypothetical protein
MAIEHATASATSPAQQPASCSTCPQENTPCAQCIPAHSMHSALSTGASWRICASTLLLSSDKPSSCMQASARRPGATANSIPAHNHGFSYGPAQPCTHKLASPRFRTSSFAAHQTRQVRVVAGGSHCIQHPPVMPMLEALRSLTAPRSRHRQAKNSQHKRDSSKSNALAHQDARKKQGDPRHWPCNLAGYNTK